MKFTDYDYKERKKKVEGILDNTDAVNEVQKFPKDENFTYENGYKAWASAIFIDLRNSTSLFTSEDDVNTSKVIRGFTSEIIEILRQDTDKEDLKEIGIRGDCVYGIYSTPFKETIFDVGNRAVYINTYLKMLNRLLVGRGLPSIKAGIGLAASETLAVKAGRKHSGINNLVWIGNAVATAAKLSDLGNKNGIDPIVMSSIFYSNYMDIKRTEQPEAESWWVQKTDESYGEFWHANVIKTTFNNWIEDGMQD